MKPFFSIIIPTLNEELFLPRNLSKLADQKERNFEVIVIDADSKDQTKAAAFGFKSKLPLRFHIVKKRNVSYQKNFGALKASGKYLIFLDADCWVSPSFTNKLKKYIDTKKGLIFLPYVDPEENTAQVKTLYKFINFVIDISQGLSKPLSSVGCMIFEKSFFHQLGGFDERVYIYEDQNIVEKAALWGVKAKFMLNIKIKFSFRRIKKEGKLKSLYKMISGTSHIIFKGEIKKKIFDYEMGGHLYQSANGAFPKHKTSKFLKQLKKTFNLAIK